MDTSKTHICMNQKREGRVIMRKIGAIPDPGISPLTNRAFSDTFKLKIRN